MIAPGLNSDVATPEQALDGLPPRPQASLRSIAIVTTLTLGQLLLQFATQLVLAKGFGAASEMDAYVAALAPGVVIATILSGSLGYVLVPIVAELLARGDGRGAAGVVSQVGLLVIGTTALLAVVMASAADPLAKALCPGFPAGEQALTAQLIAVCSILVFANSLISYLNALSHCYGRFVWPAVAGVVGTLVTLAYVIAFQPSQGIFAVVWGVVLGALLTAALQLPLFVATLAQSGPWQLALLPATRHSLQLLLPLVLAAVYWRLDPLVDRWLGSYLEPGSIAHMGYAWRLVNGLSLVGTSGLSIVAFPAIAAHAAAGRRTQLSAELAHAVRLFLFFVVPVCIGICIFATPVVRLLFERGRFTYADTQAVAMLVVLYTGVVFGTGISDLFARTFYALKDMFVPVVVTTVVFTLVVAIKFATARWWGADALVAVTSLYYLATTSVFAVIFISRLSPSMLAGAGGQLARSVAASLGACLAAAAVSRSDVPSSVLPAAVGGAVVYFVLMWMTGDEFARRIGRGGLAVLFGKQA